MTFAALQSSPLNHGPPDLGPAPAPTALEHLAWTLQPFAWPAVALACAALLAWVLIGRRDAWLFRKLAAMRRAWADPA